jgi:2-hydroxy-6-oxonona-2,4-dienedioate hydrolase
MRPLVLVIAIFFVTAVVLIVISYSRDIGTARERVSSGSQLVHTACGTIEYAEIGEGPPVLVVHGAGGGFDQGLSLGTDLAEHGFRVLSVSRFGYLRTPLPENASAEAQADAHACLLDVLGIETAAVIGASAGAPSSLQFALRHPQRSSALVLLVPALYAPRPEDAASVHTPSGLDFVFATALRSDFLLWAAIRTARPTLLRTMFATPPELVKTADKDERQRVQRMFNHVLPVSARRLGLLNDAAVISTLPRYSLEEVMVPTLVISLVDDLFGIWDAAHYTAEQIPNAHFVSYPDGGHVWVGRHRQVLDEMVSFLGDHMQIQDRERDNFPGLTLPVTAITARR